jgi:hypothetical protein
MGVDLDNQLSPRQVKVGVVVPGPDKLTDPVDERQALREIADPVLLVQVVLVNDLPAAQSLE